MKNLTLLICLLFVICNLSFATIRYVSHNSTPTPPYTTWETAADSIQKCIDYCVAGDTIIVANGTYYESLIVDKFLFLIGSSMDSTIIDGTGLNNTTVGVQADLNINGFTIIGKERDYSRYIVACSNSSAINLENCKLYKTGICVYMGLAPGKVKNTIMSDCNVAIQTFCYPDTCYYEISNSIINISNSIGVAIDVFDGGSPTITNNIILGNGSSTSGIQVEYSASELIIKNNIVSGFIARNIFIPSDGTIDSVLVENNISEYIPENNFGWSAIEGTGNAVIRNNIAAYSNIGIGGESAPGSGYNLYWQNRINTSGGITIDSTDVLANPMFVNDTIPVYGGPYDFHLQAYSPAIDAGDPDILDVDGTRSDIGVFGGPLGEEYTYQDLAPRAPVNLTAAVDSNQILLSWNRNTEADFSHYNLYRDTTEGFIIDSTKLISTQTDTFFIQTVPEGETNLYYKLTAVDSQGNESNPSEEVHIFLTGINNKKQITINNYKLYQNYPNPFNPTTRIGYRIKERGYVKLMVYDIKGELVEVLVNRVQEAGYHEAELNVAQDSSPALASGIYLYRIEVIGEGDIPRFSDMKKMILLK
jgi:hypothetical protein